MCTFIMGSELPSNISNIDPEPLLLDTSIDAGFVWAFFSDKKTEIQGYRDLNKIISRRLQLIMVLIIDGN